MERAHRVAADLARAGVPIVSGGAIGIDSAAHRGALDGGGYTLVLLGSGLGRLYPQRNRALFAKIVASGGGVASSFERDAPPIGWHFLARNRVIAALADLVLVVEGTRRSGSLNTARAGRELGRFVAACPGSSGTEALLAEGAQRVDDAADVLAILAGESRLSGIQLPPPGTPEGAVLRALGEGKSLEALAMSCQLSPRKVRRALMELELCGAVVQVGPRYRLSALAQRSLSGQSVAP
jgi:DNA processing protein